MEFFGKSIFKGMTQEEIQAYKERKRKELRENPIPDDLGPDWIDNLESIKKYFEEEVLKKGGTIRIIRRIE
jgi:hypothetical protein